MPARNRVNPIDAQDVGFLHKGLILGTFREFAHREGGVPLQHQVVLVKGLIGEVDAQYGYALSALPFESSPHHRGRVLGAAGPAADTHGPPELQSVGARIVSGGDARLPSEGWESGRSMEIHYFSCHP